jgi:hypothetical protein
MSETYMEDLQVGDRVFIEQAWEDEAGHFHDDFAEIERISGGRFYLKFERPEIDEFLKGCDWEEWQLEKI